MKLTSQEKELLFSIARTSILNKLVKKEKNINIPNEYKHLFSKGGAFVTIKLHNILRGCIGYIQSDSEIYKTVEEAAYQAAFHDPRFPPLSLDEFKDIEIEISLLSEPFPLNDYSEIIVGKHGLILEALGRRALLLPQVPIEHNMNKEQFLSALCAKAGLDSNYWREEKLSLKAFTALVLNEKE